MSIVESNFTLEHPDVIAAKQRFDRNLARCPNRRKYSLSYEETWRRLKNNEMQKDIAQAAGVTTKGMSYIAKHFFHPFLGTNGRERFSYARRLSRTRYTEQQIPERLKEIAEEAIARGLVVRAVVSGDSSNGYHAGTDELFIGEKLCGVHILTKSFVPVARYPQLRYARVVLNSKILLNHSVEYFLLRIEGYPVRTDITPSRWLLHRHFGFSEEEIRMNKIPKVSKKFYPRLGHPSGWENRWDIFANSPVAA